MPRWQRIFKETGRLPIILHIFSSGDARKAQNLYDVLYEYKIAVEPILTSLEKGDTC